MSLLTVVQDVCDIIGIERPVAVALGTGGDARQLYRLARLELSELARRTAWQALQTEQTFTVVASQVNQTGMLPTDFLSMVNETFFNRTNDNEVFGPIEPREWQLIRANASVTPTEVYRIRGSVIFMSPAPTIGWSYAFEYITNKFAYDSTLTTSKLTYLLDSDVAKLDEELIKLGIVWRWKNLKGLDYAEDFRIYEMQVGNSIARDGGKRTVSMAGDRSVAPMVGIPDGNWTP
jgi:hypothetical protein